MLETSIRIVRHLNSKLICRLILIFLLLIGSNALNAQITRYWVGGSITANFNDGTRWSLSSGGAAIGGIIGWGGADIAIFDGNSGDPTVTLNAAYTIGKLQITGNNSITVTCDATSRALTLSTAATNSLFVGSGATLIIGGLVASNSNATITLANTAGVKADINGTIRTINAGTGGGILTRAGANAEIIFKSGATYEHARNAGIIPISTWNSVSTCLITGTTNNAGLPGNLNQTFSNFTWNCSSQTGNVVLGASLTQITNNLTIISTGTGELWPGNASFNISVGGDFIISGGSLNMAAWGVNVSILLSGNFSQSGGTITESSTGSGNIVFQKSGTQTFIKTAGTISNTINFTINSGSTLDMGTSVANGAGTFTVSNGGTLQTGNLVGISSAGATGSVQTTTRVFNTGANYSYNGTSAQVTGTGLPATVNNLTINNANGVTLSSATAVTGSLALTDGAFSIGSNLLTINGDISQTTGTLTGGATSDITFGGAVASTALPTVTDGLRNLALNRANGITLGGDVTVNNQLTLTNGLLLLGSNNLTLGSVALAVAGSPSATNMVVTSGTGQIKKIIASPSAAAYTLPIGENTGTANYSPVTLTFTANSIQRTIGVRVTDAQHPNDGTATDYISRYWSFTDDQAGTYTYNASFAYSTAAPTDLTGAYANLRVNRWNSSAWTQYTTSGAAPTVTITGQTETTAALNNSDFTARVLPNTYTWVATSGSANWTTAASWNPVRTTPSVNDILVFSNGGTPTATNVPTQTIARLIVSGNTNISLQSAAAGQTLTINGGAMTNLDVQLGSTLQLSSTGTNQLSIAFTATQNSSIAGTLILNANTGLTNAYIATNSLTSVTGTIRNNGGTITSSAANLNFGSGATYIHSRTAGAIPTATWDAASNCNITGITATVTLTGSNQSFGNLTIDGSSAPAASVTITKSGAMTVKGNFAIIGKAAGVTTSFNLAGSNLTVNGTTTVNAYGIITDATNAGTNTFTGLVTVNTNGAFNITRTSPFNFNGGLTNSGTMTFGSTGTLTFVGGINNNGTITQTGAGNVRFNATQAISGTGTITLAGAVRINNGFTVTSTTTVTSAGAITGQNAASTWVNAANSSLTTSRTGTALMATGILTATAVPNTVNYSRAGTQTIKPTTFYNLTLSGTLAKTFPAGTTTVTNILLMGGTTASATVTGTLTYGPNAQLQYNKTTAFTTGNEWQTPFNALGGVVIAGTGVITMGTAKVLGLNAPLTINNLATLATNNLQLTFGGNFVKTGTLTAGSSPIVITNTMANQSIDCFSTTGLVTMSKTSGTATFTCNVTCGGITINGTGGTLNLGTNLSHTSTGAITLTAGTLNSSSSTLSVSLTPGTAWNMTGATFTAGTGKVIFNGAGAQTITGSTTFNRLTFAGSGLKTLTTANCIVSDTMSMAGSATASAVPSYGAASTLQYIGTALQTTGPEFPALFAGSGGVIINNASGVNLGVSSGTSSTLTLTSGNFTLGAFTLTLNGPAIAGTPTNLKTSATSSLSFGGSSSSIQIPSSVTTLNNLTINNSNGVTLNSSPTLSGALTLSSGILSTGANTILATTTTTTSRTTGWVYGKLQLPVPLGAAPSKTYYIGDASNYTPVTVAYTTVTTAGFLTASTTAGQHPNITTAGINYSLDVNRYYTLTNSGIVATSFSPTFTFVAGDILGGANTANFSIARYSAAWFATTIGAKTGTTTQATGLTAYGDFAIGEAQSLHHFALVLASPQTTGLAFVGTNTLTACDISGNPIAVFSAALDNVTLSGNAPLTGAITGLSGVNKLNNAADFVSGVANLTSLGLKYTGATGTGTFTATSGTGKTGTSGSVTIAVGDLVFSAIGAQTAGTGFSVTITARDAASNPVNVTSNSNITLSLATGTGALGGTVTGTILSGSNSVTISGVTYNKAEAGVSITATQTSGTPLLSPGTSNTFTVNPGAATKLSLSAIATQTAGAGFNVIITALDALNNITNVSSTTGISLTKATGSGTLGGTTTGSITIGTNNVTISGVTYNVAETGVSITASTSSGMALTAATSNIFTVVPDPARSALTPTSSSIIANGITTQTLTVQAKDANGLNLSTGGAVVTITKLSGTGSIGSVTDNGNGTYTASVTSTVLVGSGIFVATLNGSNVNSGTGSQTQATVNYTPGPASGVQSTITPTIASIADDGVATQVLTVHAIDVNGNSLTAGGSGVTITLQSGVGSITSVTDNGNGTYSATVSSTVAGTGTFVATIGGSPVQSGTASQTQVIITFNLGAVNAAASDLSPTTGNIDISGTIDLTVQAQDATGNNLSSGGATVAITRSAGTGSISAVTDNGDGTYTATVTGPGSSGSGSFVATINGSQVKSGTASQTIAIITYGASAAKSTLTPTSAVITGDGVTTIDLTVQAKDINGIDITTGGETVVISKQSGSGTVGAVTDNLDGTYTATVTSANLPAGGNGVFVATMGGNPVQSGTASQTQTTITYAGTANAVHSTLTPISTCLLADGLTTVDLVVQAKDVNNFDLSTGGATVTITGPGNVSSVSDNLDGTYSATITSSTTNASEVYVATLNGSPVQSGTGSQTQATVTYTPDLTVESTSVSDVCLGGSSTVTISATSLPIGSYTVNYTLTGVNAQGATNIAMNVIGGNSGSFVTPILAATGTTTVTINSITINGCLTNATAGNTASINVNPFPAAIGGTLTVCAGSNTTLTNASAGGSWTSASLAIATIVAGTGEVTGVSAGTSLITYTLPTGCSITATVTVNPLPAVITGTMNVNVGATTALSDATAGGTWNSASTAIATIDAFGVVTGISGGTSVISYTLGTGCSVSSTVTVNPLPVTPGAISGTSVVCQGDVGATYTVPAITNATGYVWTLPSGGNITAGTNTNSITVSYTTSAASGNVIVYGTNGSGNGPNSAPFAVTVNLKPAQEPMYRLPNQ